MRESLEIARSLGFARKEKQMDFINKIISRLDISSLRFKRLTEEEQKPSLLRDVLQTPEKFKLEAVIEGEEIHVSIKRR